MQNEAHIDTAEQISQQKKKNKNKNKREKEKAKKAAAVGGDGDQPANQKQISSNNEANFLEKIQKLLGSAMANAPNFDKIDEFEGLIENEMSAIREILTKVAKDDFSSVPDEQREVPNDVDEEAFKKVTQKSPKHANGLRDLKEKIDLLKYKHDDAVKLESSFPGDQRMIEVLKSVQSNLDDDVRRNQEVFSMLVTSILSIPSQ